MDAAQVAARLKDLARNFYWGWHPEVVAVFRDLEQEASLVQSNRWYLIFDL
jgi:hypothetical protein